MNPEGDQIRLAVISGVNTQTKELTEKVFKAAQSDRRERENQLTSSLSLAKLRLADLRLHGREDDTRLLRTKLHELYDDAAKKRPELLLVRGVSGSGKSALVMRGLRDPAREMGIVFAGGKFDLNRTAMPLAAFVDAISSLTKFIVANDHLQKMRYAMKQEFGEDDMMLLARAMAGCEGLFPIERVSQNSCISSNLQVGSEKCGKEAVMRLQYAIRRLLKVICTNLKGVVLFIDDLQWSDTATLDLIRSVSLDAEIPSLLLVGAYREDEVSDSHPLALHIRELGEQRGIAITTISVKNLGPRDVMSLVADVLRMKDDENAVSTLAASVYKKTEGNAFFVLMFLRYLYDEGLIQFNFFKMSWSWDDSAISSTMVMQNVATVLVNKLKRFKAGFQNVLMVASCLGASFSTPIITMVVETLSTSKGNISDWDETESLVASSVEEFSKDGIWEDEGGDVCRFSHDQIQSAAFELIPSDKIDSFRGKVGNALMKRLDPDSLEECLFEVVSLQNCDMSSMSEDQRKALAKMNLRAGRKASSNASFVTAVVYFKSGRELLGRSWEVDPDTMLQLCSEEANARFIANDDLETMNALINEVMDQPIPLRDKFKVYEVKVKSALGAGNLHECLDTALEFCRKLGLPAPKNKPVSTFIILKEHMKTKHALRNRTAEEIACLPELIDEQIIMGRKMLIHAAGACFMAQPTLFPIVNFLMIRSTMKYGVNASSCDGFACFGLVLCGLFGKINKGREMAKAADLILAKRDSKVLKSRIVFVCETFVLHWTAPMQASFDPLLEGYQIGLETGDIDSAGWCLAFRCHHLFCAGRSLEGLQREIRACIDILSQLNLEAHRLCVLPYLLAVMKLREVDIAEECMGMDFEAILDAASEMGNSLIGAVTKFAQLELMVVFKEWERASELLIEAGNLRLEIPGHFVGVRFTALDALISLKAAQTSSSFLGRMLWKRRGLKSMKLLRSWIKKGNGNVVHLHYILSAELAVLEGKGKRAEDNFQSAVKIACRSGLLQDRALAHGLAAAYHTKQGDNYWAGYHNECSQEAYAAWGAKLQVQEEA